MGSITDVDDDDEETQPFDETVPIIDLIKTQVVSDSDCEENVNTQALDDDNDGGGSDGGEGGESDRTEVLSDGSEDEGRKREVANGGGVVVSEFEGLVVADSEDEEEIERRRKAGTVRRSFTCIRAASLRASGLAASSKPMGNRNKYFKCLNPSAIQFRDEIEYNQMIELKDDETVKCVTNVNDDNVEVKCTSAKSAVRKLFSENSPSGKSEPSMDNMPGIATYDHEFAGLSYVASEEPGDLSQLNALNIVDTLLTNSSSPDVDHEKKVKKKSYSPVSSAKRGSRSLAQKSCSRSPLAQAGVFDWIDSREDACGGDFFSKQKEALFGSGRHGRGSVNRSLKVRRQSKIGKEGIIKLEEKGEGLKFHQRIMGLLRSDSKLVARKSDEKGKVLEEPQTKIGKSISRNLNEELNAEAMEQRYETNCLHNSTQMADEASNHGSHKVILVEPNEKRCASSKKKKALKAKSTEVPRATRSTSKGKSKNPILECRPDERVHEVNCTDVGTETQMAVESIEALVHGDCPNLETARLNIIEPNDDERLSSKRRKVHEVKSSRVPRFTRSTSQGKMKNPMEESTPNKQQREGKCADESIRTRMTDATVEAIVHGELPNNDTNRTKKVEGSGNGRSLSRRRKIHEVKSSIVSRCTRSTSRVNSNSRSNEQQCEANCTDALVRVQMEAEIVEAKAEGDPPNHETPEENVVEPNNGLVSLNRTRVHELDISKVRRCTRGSSRGIINKLFGQFGASEQLRDTNLDDTGVETQMAAEAMEDLVYGDPLNQVIYEAYKADPNDDVSSSSRRKKAHEVKSCKESRCTRSTSRENSKTTKIELLPNEEKRETSYPDVGTLKSLKPDASGQNKELASANAEKISGDKEEAKGQSTTKRKRSKDDVKNINLDFKRRKRSCKETRLPLPTLDEKSEGSLSRKDRVQLGFGNAALECSFTLMNEKVAFSDPLRDCSNHFEVDRSEDDPKFANNTDGNVRTESSLRETSKSSGLRCDTPVECTTPINPASPICVGNEYRKQPYRKHLSRSPLLKELKGLNASNAIITSGSKNLRKTKDRSDVRILFSRNLMEDLVNQQKKILTRLGALVASTASGATHFVTDTFVRTRNMLEAIALGIPVVTHFWLESCGHAGHFIDEKKYLLRDHKKEKEIGFNMQVSLARACQSPLLKGKKVFITQNIKPSKEVIAGLVKAVQGLAVERIGRTVTKSNKIPDNLLVLSCEEDYAICAPLLEKGASVYSSEVLLNGIVIQKLEYDSHQLFTDYVKKTRSTIRMRKDGNKFFPVNKCK